MSFDRSADAPTPASLPIQFVHIEITPLIDGQYSVNMEATRLDEEHLDFVGEDLAHKRVKTFDEMLAVIRENVAILAAGA